MSEFAVALVAVGGTVIALGLLQRKLQRTIFSPQLLALLLGVAIGPHALGLLNPKSWPHSHLIVEHTASLTIAIGLMGVALRLPPGYSVRHWRSLGVLLGLVMPLTWMCSSGLAYWMLGVPPLVALIIGAIACPTDPVVATAIVTGDPAKKHLPARLRHTLSAESGANDGLAYPIVLLGVLLLTKDAGEAWFRWGWHTVLWGVGGAAVIGCGIGFVAAKLLRLAEKDKTVDQHSFLAFTLALTLLTLGAAELAGINGILAVFVVGIVLDRLFDTHERHEEERVQEAVNQFFTLPIFGLLGLILPWDDWYEWGWTAVAFAAAVLLLRRLPFVLLFYGVIPTLRRRRDAMFVGWFGPIGVAALYYAMLAEERTGQKDIWTFGSLLIASSLLAHGMTAAPLIKLYARLGRV